MSALNPVAVDAMLELLFVQFQEHRWQTKLAAVRLFASLASANTKAVTFNLPKVVRALMEVSQDPKPQIKETALAALKSCVQVIDNPDVIPVLDAVISANLNPETESESCLDRLVATTYVNNVDKATLSVIVPILLRGLRVRGNVIMQRKAAIVMDTMCKLVKDPEEIAPFTDEVIPDLTRNAEEIAIPEVRERTAEALNTVKVAMGEALTTAVQCDKVEVEAVLSEQISGNAYNSDEVSQWAAQVCTPFFKDARPRTNEMVVPYLLAIMSEAEAIINGEKFLETGAAKFGAGQEEEVVEDHDDLAVLCDCKFSLAYGNRVLLHNTHLRLKRGKCYGLIGPNGAGKSTLMRSIAAGVVEGFPKEIRSVYVECDVSAADADYICWEFIHKDPLIQEMGKTKEQVIDMMRSCTFDDKLIYGPVGSLSGGWRMRLALSRAMLKEPELLLLDEPTNHVDVHGVAWLTKYVQELSDKQISSMIVSHDSVFLDNVAQDMVHYEKNRKLKVYKGNLSEFVKLVPEAAAYYKLESDNIAFSFPDPGMLEGVTSRTKALIKMSDVSFKYPTRTENTLNNISVQVSMASRVAVIGVNGAGKSTMIKLMVGEIEPNEEGAAKIVKHPNMRLAYVAQHAFHHIENHLELTPTQYIEWRFQGGMDREGAAKNYLELTEDEQKLIDQKTGQIQCLRGRRKGKKGNEYEVVYFGQDASDALTETTWMSKDALMKMTWTDQADKKKTEYPLGPAVEKLMMQVDERIAFEQSGIATKKLSTLNVQKHLDSFNLESQFGTYSKIHALSGGQKVKVVLAAALWNTPHIIILDEPTNYLDRDSLGAMAEAINLYEGGVVIISHNAQFVDQVCPEVWHLENHTLNLKGSYDWLESANKEAAKLEKQAETYIDGTGNEVKIEKAKKKASKAELKKIKKAIAEKRKGGLEVYTDEELEANGFLAE